jgi:hypothetical protein
MKLEYFQIPASEGKTTVELRLAPYHLVLDCDRVEVEGQTGVEKNEEVLHVRVYDRDKDKTAHFHVSVGVRRGRPFCEVAAMTEGKSVVKRATATWRDAALSSLGDDQ